MKQSRRPTLELICGPSCLGKTTFTKNIDSKYCYEKLNISLKDQIYDNVHNMAHMSQRAFRLLNLNMLDWVYTYCADLTLFLCYRLKGPPNWDHRWDVIKDHPIKKRAIILCISESEWHRRIKKREPLKKESFGTFYDHYKDTYIKWVEELDRYNIPYIFIDNNKENNYPVINKLEFLKNLNS